MDPQKVEIEWLSLLLRFQKVPARDPAILTEGYRDSPHTLQANAVIVP
jgi:hypothetical protein